MLTKWLAEAISLYPILLPMLISHLVLMFFALSDLSKRESTRGPKGMWVVIVILINFIGPVAYYLIGRRKDAEATKPR